VGYADLFSPETLDSAVVIRRRMWEGRISDPALGGVLLVSEEAGDVVGFIHCGPAEANRQVGEVYAFYVHPASWGKGSAQALMDAAAEALAETFTSAVLWTHEGAGRARHFTDSRVGQKRATSVE
jgi:GNAT superfamily N-acetyltransferase